MRPLFLLTRVATIAVTGVLAIEFFRPQSSAGISEDSDREIPYRKGCLRDETCPEPERVLAVEEYAGATRGQLGQVLFDGFSKPAERAAIRKVIGPFPQKSHPSFGTRIYEYLTRTRQRFLSQHSLARTPDYCADPEAVDYTIRRHPRYGQAFVLSGPTFCGERFANLYLFHGLEMAVATSPEQWVFFLEPYLLPPEKIGALQRNLPAIDLRADMGAVEEAAYFYQIAAALGIPVLDPGHTPFQPAVLRQFERENEGVSLPKILAYMILGQLFMQREQHHLKITPARVEATVRFFGTFSEVDIGEVRTELASLTVPYEGCQNCEFDPTELVTADRIARDMNQTAISLGEGVLRRELADEGVEGRSMALFVLGEGRDELVKRVYEPKPE